MSHRDAFSEYVFETSRRTGDRLGVPDDASFDDIADRLCISYEEAVARWEAAREVVKMEMAAERIMQPAPPTPDEYLASLDLSEDIHRVPLDDGDEEQEWERLTAEPRLRGVGSSYRPDPDWPWSVTVWVMEFVGEEPLESTLRGRISRALRNVRGVSEVLEEDREVWVVSGSPSGDALVRAAAGVVDELAPQLRAFVEGRTP